MQIAIIGMACVFPGAPTLDDYWHNIVNGVDAITDVPAARWDASFYDPDSSAIDRFYCKRGGFIDAYTAFDATAYGVMPKAAAAADPDQMLTLKIGYAALADAGYAERPFARATTGVIVGRGNYVSAGTLRLEQHVRLLPQLLQTLRDLFPDLPDAALEQARARVQSELSYYGPDVAAGMIPNLIASRLANRLDLHGPAYTVDAACASSLIALEQACQSLTHGATDMMLVGGAHLSHDLTFWATFCQLGALSRRGESSPLSAAADGILAGEGIGMVVLKRLDDALAAGDRVYAVIAGVGSSSDGRSSSLVAPSASGQQIALEKAWVGLGIAPDSIGLVEAHGTGTPAGDEAELTTMQQFFGAQQTDAPRPVIGSVKSMIGHTMPAAGIAGLIKSALAVYHGVLPPTLHCASPHPALAATRFRAIGKAEPWPQPIEQRVAAVNAFGFGGINAHVVLHGVEASSALAAIKRPEVLTLSAATAADLLRRLENGERDARPGQGGCRLAIINPDAKKIALAKKVITSGKPWHGRQQIYFSADGLIAAGGKTTFVFPGVDSRFAPQADDLARYFKRPLPRYCETLNPQDALMPVVLGLLGFNRMLFDILRELGIKADAMAGHSVGEWSAMLASGMMDQGLSDRTNATLDLDTMQFPDVLFIAASCEVATLEAALDGLDGIDISHDNCPHQAIACGVRAAVDTLAARLRERAILYQVLPIVSGFHSPLFAQQMGWYREFFGSAELVEPQVPVWSATTAACYPQQAAEKWALALDHLLNRVRFRELIEALYADGQRVFVQVGTGSLVGFINDTLGSRPHLALQTNVESRSGLVQLTQACAALWVEGAEFDTQLLHTAHPAHAERGEPLALGVPLLRIREPLAATPRIEAAAPVIPSNDPVQAMLATTMADIARAGDEVMALWNRHSRAARPSGLLNLRSERVLDIATTIPYVDDHALYPQRPGWPVLADRHPVVPLTMEVMLLRQAVEAALPDKRVIEVRDIQAYNWLVVADACPVTITLKSRDEHTIDAEIAGYFRAVVVVADDYPVPKKIPGVPLLRTRATRIDADALYRERWMFHGAAYQGVARFDAIGDNGIDGVLRVPSGLGALLDNMGQLAGYWVMEQPINCLAMPIGVDSIVFLGDDPAVGETLTAEIRVRKLDAQNCVTDHVLRDANGRDRVRISGWQTRRYQMDERFWLHSRQLERQTLGHALADGMMLFDDRYDTAILRDYIARRYLAAAEMALYDTLPPRRRRDWLNGRVAAKDAVRHVLWRTRGLAAIYPKELCIDNDAAGAPQVRANVTTSVPATMQVSLAHKDGLAVALAGDAALGIDLERIATREQSFVDTAFSRDEQQFFGGESHDLAVTRAWVAKEVAGKAMGTGLGGHMRSLTINARDGDRLRVSGHWVSSVVAGDYVLGWSTHAGVDEAQVAAALASLPLDTLRAKSTQGINYAQRV
jgi:3-oxoacyl-(acyl-carrier-protein) synthase/phosphopantetheinyl transferase